MKSLFTGERRHGRRAGLSVFFLALLLLCVGHPQAFSEQEQLPLPPAVLVGAAALHHDALDLDWTDVKRQRAVPVRLYWPRSAAAHDKVPLVVFSHGIGSSRHGYSYLGQYWADHGYASLHVQHVGSDSSVWWGNPLKLLSRLHHATSEEEAINRVLDLRFALDQILADPIYGPHLDGQRIIAAGHSYGANTTLLAAGARVEHGQHVVDYHDPRIKAAVLISTPPFYGETNPAAILAHVLVPTLHVTNTDDVIRIPGYYSAAADRVAMFDATGGARKWLAVFNGGSHNIFTDRAGPGTEAFNAEIKGATRELSLAFFHEAFDPRDTELRRWPALHRGILQRYTQPGM